MLPLETSPGAADSDDKTISTFTLNRFGLVLEAYAVVASRRHNKATITWSAAKSEFRENFASGQSVVLEYITAIF